jgi:hypothetical protein
MHGSPFAPTWNPERTRRNASYLKSCKEETDPVERSLNPHGTPSQNFKGGGK